MRDIRSMSQEEVTEVKELGAFGITYREVDFFAAFAHHTAYPGFKALSLPDGRNIVDVQRNIEHVGDRVIGLFFSLQMFHGEVTSHDAYQVITSNAVFAKLMEEIGFDQYVKCDRDFFEEHRVSVLADAFEMFIGVVFLNNGYEKTETLLKSLFHEHIKNLRVVDVFSQRHPKVTLQRLVNINFGAHPIFRISVTNKGVRCKVYARDTHLGTGVGSSRQAATKNAARDAVENFNWGIKREDA